jgi:hypothetical protein
MSFDDQVRTTLETLSGRLRENIVSELLAVTDELTAAARSDRERAAADAATAARADAERDADARVANVTSAAETHTALSVAMAEARAAQAMAAAEARATQAVAAAEARTAQAVAAAEARVREQAEQHTRDAIEAAVTAARAEVRDPDPAASEPLAEAIRAIDAAASVGGTLDTLVMCASREAARVALLLLVGGTLRGRQFVGFGPGFASAREVVVPMAEAGVIREAIRFGSLAINAGDPGSAPSFARDLEGGRSMATPILVGGQTVAVLYADLGAAEADGRSPSNWWDRIEVLARHATRCLEATIAFSAARLLTGPAGAQAGLSVANTGREFTSDEDEAARRYARLLVSEIKLYHEPDVIAGRRERDLTKRLGAEIDRARVFYEQRVPPHLRSRTDYFHAELVRTLADGDASLLEVGGR